jgi:hypothetical protein
MGSAVGAPQLRYMRTFSGVNDCEIPAAAFLAVDLALELQLQAVKGPSFSRQFLLHVTFRAPFGGNLAVAVAAGFPACIHKSASAL